MPYFKLGRIDKFEWSKDLIELKSVLKQTCFALLSAYEKHKFIHKDTHLGNILVKKNNHQNKTIQYTSNITLTILTYEPIIMDFDRSIIDSENNLVKLVYADIKRILSLISSELDMKLNVNSNILNEFISNNTPINVSIYTIIEKTIDDIEYMYTTSKLKIPTFSW